MDNSWFPTFGEVAQIITGIGVILGLLVSWHNGKKIHNVHIDLNSRLSQLLKSTHSEAFLAGRLRERDDANGKPGSDNPH